MNDQLHIREMEFHAYHGCLPEEEKIGARYTVSLCFTLDLSLAAQTDDLTKTVDYVRVYDLVKEEMHRRSKLIEEVALRIVKRMLTEFLLVDAVEIHLIKHEPPVQGRLPIAEVRLRRNRS